MMNRSMVVPVYIGWAKKSIFRVVTRVHDSMQRHKMYRRPCEKGATLSVVRLECFEFYRSLILFTLVQCNSTTLKMIHYSRGRLQQHCIIKKSKTLII